MKRVLLKTEGLTKYFGGLRAVSSIDMYVDEGEIVGVIGPNGAGKTTFFNLIAGVLRPSLGRIYFDGNDITRKKPHEVAAMGIGRTFQLAESFLNLTVLENVVTSFYLHARCSLWDTVIGSSRYRKKEASVLNQAREILEVVGLAKVEQEKASHLPHGYQKLLSLARALAVKPTLLLLDEPVGGMTPEEIKLGMEVVKKVRSQGVTIVIVEHNMQIMELCDRIIVLNFGHKIAEGLPREIRDDDAVIQAYFGADDAA
jgi:branched-chain amino acid transport system ATP-binding protein